MEKELSSLNFDDVVRQIINLSNNNLNAEEFNYELKLVLSKLTSYYLKDFKKLYQEVNNGINKKYLKLFNYIYLSYIQENRNNIVQREQKEIIENKKGLFIKKLEKLHEQLDLENYDKKEQKLILKVYKNAIRRVSNINSLKDIDKNFSSILNYYKKTVENIEKYIKKNKLIITSCLITFVIIIGLIVFINSGFKPKYCYVEYDKHTAIKYGFKYEEQYEDTYIFTGVKGKMFKKHNSLSVIIIPDMYNGKLVTGIAPNALAGKKEIQKVYLTNNIVNIGSSAFKNCTNLEIITVDETLEKNIMPEPLKSINKETFYGCTSLKDLYFGKNLLFIDKTAFNETPNIKKLYFEFGKYEKSISFDSLGKSCYFSKYNIKVTSQKDSSKTIYLSYDKNNDAQLSAPIIEGYKVIGYYFKNVKIADGDGILFDQFQYFYDIEVTAKYEKE